MAAHVSKIAEITVETKTINKPLSVTARSRWRLPIDGLGPVETSSFQSNCKIASEFRFQCPCSCIQDCFFFCGFIRSRSAYLGAFQALIQVKQYLSKTLWHAVVKHHLFVNI